MGYDLELVQVPVPAGASLPLEPAVADKLRAKAKPIGDADAIRAALLAVKGCRPGPEGAIDFLGAGLSYARFSFTKTAIHVENNCGPRDLLAIYEVLREICPQLLIRDLQSGQLHDAESFRQWWSRPL